MITLSRSFGSSAREKFLQNLNKVPKPHPRLSKLSSSMAVFIPLYKEGNEERVLLTKRSSLLRSHRGEVCFPGGKQDKGESLEQTALRETHEEIGLVDQAVDVWGELHPVVTKQLTSSVTPIVGSIENLSELQNLKVNTDEVHVLFSVPVEELCHSVRYTQFKNKKIKYRLPVFESDSYKILFKHPDTAFHGDLRIWGLSAVILHQLLVTLYPHYAPDLEIAFY
ncbi:unnamed protein product [Auanema sp. JU1783]|nr:unnamed protein product [Auanema sp. JU1783]